MDRKNLLVAGGLIGGIIVLLVIGASIFYITTDLSSMDDSAYYIDESTEYNPNYYSNESETPAYISFDNSTPEVTAKSIARLSMGVNGFMSEVMTNASLSPDGKYWMVRIYTMQYGDDDFTVTVDAKTLMSKQNGNESDYFNSWRSFDELKASYIAEMQFYGIGETHTGRPQKITADGKEIWKVPVYEPIINFQDEYVGDKLVEYVYVDVATGKSKIVYNRAHGGIFDKIYSFFFNDPVGTDWLTLKQVDDELNSRGSLSGVTYGAPFRNALRDLYHE
jgi:hypothetical protein